MLQGASTALAADAEPDRRDRRCNTVGYCIGGTLLSRALAHMAAKGDDRRAPRPPSSPPSRTSPRPATCSCSPTRTGSTRSSRRRWTKRRRAARPDHGRHLQLAARQRPDLVVLREQLPAGQGAQALRPAVLELRPDAHARGRCTLYYLRNFYNENALAKGELVLDGERLDLGKVKMPVYVQSSTARTTSPRPARSIAARALLVGGPVTFTMAGSGHIAGVVNPPRWRQVPVLDEAGRQGARSGGLARRTRPRRRDPGGRTGTRGWPSCRARRCRRASRARCSARSRTLRVPMSGSCPANRRAVAHAPGTGAAARLSSARPGATVAPTSGLGSQHERRFSVGSNVRARPALYLPHRADRQMQCRLPDVPAHGRDEPVPAERERAQCRAERRGFPHALHRRILRPHDRDRLRRRLWRSAGRVRAYRDRRSPDGARRAAGDLDQWGAAPAALVDEARRDDAAHRLQARAACRRAGRHEPPLPRQHALCSGSWRTRAPISRPARGPSGTSSSFATTSTRSRKPMR